MTRSSSVRLGLFEARRAGIGALVAVPLALIAGAAMVIVTAVGGRDVQSVAGTVLEALLPLAAALAVSSILDADSLVELQLSLPTPYRLTVARRVLCVLGLAALIDLAAAAGASGTGLWTSSHGAIAIVLMWMAPTLALAGLALVLSLGFQSTPLAAGVVAALWIGEQSFKGWFAAHTITRALYLFAETRPGVVPATAWASNRLTLLAFGLVALGGAWLALANRERLFNTGGSAK